jgi:hypothetical protein
MLPLCVKDAVVRTDGDTPSTPLGPVRPSATILITAQRRAALLVVLVRNLSVLSEDATQEPAPAQIISVDDTAAAELDALACVVDPSKVNVERGLDDTEDDGDLVRAWVAAVEASNEPVDAVECTG